MDFKVLSRESARKMSFNSNIDDCIIISISDSGSDKNVFSQNPHIKGICWLEFDDVERGEPNCITEQDCKTIIDFVNYHVNDVSTIIVQCEAGVSRSSGVCAALMNILTGTDDEIFDNPNFCPNMTCYRAVMTFYFGSYNQKKADEKLNRNIELWKEREGIK